MGLSIPGSGLIKKAAGVGRQVAGAAREVAATAAHAGGDAVHLSAEAAEAGLDAQHWVSGQQKSFGQGVVEWGKSTAGTVVGLASHPVATAQALGHLAQNPVLNPTGGALSALVHGKSPVQAYKDGLSDLKALGAGLVSDYKQVYQKHGAAGVAGFAAPDVVTAVLSGGSSEAAKAGGTVAAKAVAESTSRRVARDVAEEFVPGPSDVADSNRKAQKPTHQNFLESLISNFQLS